MRYSIQMVGVGGQGVLLASMVIGEAAMHMGLDVVMSEVHGMAQRGGSVTSIIRMGEGVISPLIPKGGADLLLAFEPIEAYRSLDSANKDTYIITNTHPIIPITVSMGADQYPDIDQVIEKMRSVSSKVVPVDATGIATGVGGAIATNSVLIGAVAAVEGIPISEGVLKDSLLDRVPTKFREMNEKAFQCGLDYTRKFFESLE
jgi:indolepyruvate ferredoxin oxidoreductase beta subunit